METEKETCTRPKWMTKLLHCSRGRGGISPDQLPSVLVELNPTLKNVDGEALAKLIKQNIPTGSTVLDFDTVTKILFQLILKEPSQDVDSETLHNSFVNQSVSDCSCSVPGSCDAMKITDFIIFPTF